MNADAIIHHAGWILFVWVFANQSGVPVPVVPTLVAAGALAGRGGPNWAVMLAAAASAAVGADMVWYGIGRWRGTEALSLISRLLRRPSTYTDHVEQAFRAHDVRFQFWGQFMPEVNPIAAGLAGASGVAFARYLVIAGATAVTWAGTWITAGYLLPDVFGDLTASLGGPIVILVVVAVLDLVAIRYARRRRSRTGFMKSVLVLVIAGALSGCASVGPDYKRPAIATTPQWHTPSEGLGSLADLEWWQSGWLTGSSFRPPAAGARQRSHACSLNQRRYPIYALTASKRTGVGDGRRDTHLGF